MKNVIAVLFVLVTQAGCFAFYSHDNELNGIASSHWRDCIKLGKNCH